MKANDLNIALIDNYFELLKNLSPDNKLELIARLSKSMKSTKKKKTEALQDLYGTFISEKSAEELISEIKSARRFDRKRAVL
jgi:predicted metal-binding transcription factor (methanogenesis marker protein 9)